MKELLEKSSEEVLEESSELATELTEELLELFTEKLLENSGATPGRIHRETSGNLRVELPKTFLEHILNKFLAVLSI